MERKNEDNFDSRSQDYQAFLPTDSSVNVPTGPYFFKNSSRFPGQALESFILKDSEVFFSFLKRIHREKDSLNDHLEFLLKASNYWETKFICPICREKPVKYFIFLNFNYLSSDLTCCDSEYCKHELRSGRENSSFRKINLKGFASFKSDKNRKQAEVLLRKVLGLKKDLSAEEVFSFIKEGYDKHLKLLSQKKAEKVESSGPPEISISAIRAIVKKVRKDGQLYLF